VRTFRRPYFSSSFLARDRARAHPAVFGFYLHFFTARHKTLCHCILRGEGNAVICLHLLLHLVQTEGEREKKPSFTKTNTTNHNPIHRKGEGNFADCLHPYSIHAQEDTPIR
jgi:hypothetical protein